MLVRDKIWKYRINSGHFCKCKVISCNTSCWVIQRGILSYKCKVKHKDSIKNRLVKLTGKESLIIRGNIILRILSSNFVLVTLNATCVANGVYWFFFFCHKSNSYDSYKHDTTTVMFRANNRTVKWKKILIHCISIIGQYNNAFVPYKSAFMIT